MKVRQIVTVIEQYNAYKNKLRQEMLDYEDYKVFDNDDIKAREMRRKIEIDKKILGNFLDTEV